MIRFHLPGKKAGARARELQSAWAVRAFIVAGVLSAAAVTAISLLLPESKPASVTVISRTGREFSPTMNRQQLLDAVKASEAAFRVYLKRDRVLGDFEAIAREFEDIKSDSDLVQLLTMLASAAGDDYFAVLTNQQYEHLSAVSSGGKIAVDFDFSYEWQKNAWEVSKVGPTAEAAGLKKGDQLHSINGYLAIPSDDFNQRNALERQMKMRMLGLINTPVEVVVRRDGQLNTVRLKVQVVSRSDAFSVDDMEHPLDRGKVKDFKTITFNHLRSATILTDLHQQLRSWQATGVRGIAIDLRNLSEGEGEKAVRVAAMFREKGVLSRLIETTPDGDLVMKTWEIVDRAVRLTTKGPFKVGADGTVVMPPSAPEMVQVKDWPTNVYRGPVVALFGRQTSGVGELIASALKESWRVEKRGMTVAKFYSWGKGTSQTYFPIGNGYWLALSTAFYLQPDGSSIEGRVGPAPNVACPSNQTDEWWFTRYTLVDRLNVVPRPEWPGSSK